MTAPLLAPNLCDALRSLIPVIDLSGHTGMTSDLLAEPTPLTVKLIRRRAPGTPRTLAILASPLAESANPDR